MSRRINIAYSFVFTIQHGLLLFVYNKIIYKYHKLLFPLLKHLQWTISIESFLLTSFLLTKHSGPRYTEICIEVKKLSLNEETNMNIVAKVGTPWENSFKWWKTISMACFTLDRVIARMFQHSARRVASVLAFPILLSNQDGRLFPMEHGNVCW